MIEVRKLGPKYTYYVRFDDGARPYTPSTGFFDSEEDAIQAALKKATQLRPKRG
ncbi:hypothetical protein [Caballeronia choica]|uniref:hypothetical protein n=1 Tax=Caballeronia choica TaxID=326476 RepID=UPI00135C544B|nr:hypothetical protein [Caballeronia choica]